MKRYNNLAFQIVVLLPISSLLYLLIIIIGSIFIRNQGLDFIIMCIVLSYVFVMIWFVLFFMKDIFIITYYDEEKIYQRNLWRKKSIRYEHIKEIYIAGSHIYLSSGIYDLNYDSKERFLSRKIQKILKKEIVIMVTRDPQFLKYISLDKIKIRKFKNSISNSTNKYFNHIF